MKKALACLAAMVMTVSFLGGCGSQTETAKTDSASTEPAAAESAAPADDTASEAPAADNASEAPAAESTGSHKFGFSVPTMNNPFFLSIHDAAKATIEGNGDTFVAGDPQMDPQKQISQIEDMLTQGIDIMVLCPIDSASIKAALTACADKNVPVIIYDTPVHDPELVITTVASDNRNAGAVVAKDMKGKLPEGSKVAIMHSPAAQACVERVEGFIAESDGYFNIIGDYDGQGDTGVTMPIAEDVLQGNPDLGAFFCVNDPSAIGCVQALESAGRTGEVLVYGVDGAPEAKHAIKDGTMSGTGAQSPVNLGKIAVESAYKHLNGESLEKDTVVDTFIINTENIDQYDLDGWQ
jgi:ABC-type sugar transport system, periplasmic component